MGSADPPARGAPQRHVFQAAPFWHVRIRTRSVRPQFPFGKMWPAAGVKAERVVYLDADTIVMRNIDELFSSRREVVAASEPTHATCCPGNWDAALLAVPDFGYACGTSHAAGVCRRFFARGDKFNSGVMVVRPSRVLLEDLLMRQWTTASLDGGDQGLLNAVVRKWGSGPGRLPFQYNTFAAEEFLTGTAERDRRFDLERISVLHFAGPKPWNRRSTIGAQSLRAFDRAIASYRRRCQAKRHALARGRPATWKAQVDRMLRDARLAAKHRGKHSGTGTHIPLHELYGTEE